MPVTGTSGMIKIIRTALLVEAMIREPSPCSLAEEIFNRIVILKRG
jgi:hypothetical protein